MKVSDPTPTFNVQFTKNFDIFTKFAVLENNHQGWICLFTHLFKIKQTTFSQLLVIFNYLKKST